MAFNDLWQIKKHKKTNKQITLEGLSDAFLNKPLEDRQLEMQEKQREEQLYKDTVEYKESLKELLDNDYRVFKFFKQDIKKFLGPIVYIYWQHLEWDKEKYAIYVGMSTKGMGRPLAHDHHRKEECLKADALEIIPCKTDNDAKELEKRLIIFLRPKVNSRSKKVPRSIFLPQVEFEV